MLVTSKQQACDPTPSSKNNPATHTNEQSSHTHERTPCRFRRGRSTPSQPVGPNHRALPSGLTTQPLLTSMLDRLNRPTVQAATASRTFSYVKAQKGAIRLVSDASGWGADRCAVRVFRQKFTLEDAIGKRRIYQATQIDASERILEVRLHPRGQNASSSNQNNTGTNPISTVRSSHHRMHVSIPVCSVRVHALLVGLPCLDAIYSANR
jgi:hypothetical protein